MLTSVAAARRLGIARERWVFLPGHADLRERDLLDRADLSASPAAVKHGRDGARTGIVIGRLADGGQRFAACTDDRDADLMGLLAAGEPVSERVHVRSFGSGNRVARTEGQLGPLYPAASAG